MLNYDEIKKELQRIESSKTSRDSIPRLKLNKAGKTAIRILPEYDEKGLFFFKVMYHWHIEEYPIVCNRTWEQPCVVCELLSEFRTKNPNKKGAWKYSAQISYLMNVVNAVDSNTVLVADFFSKIAQPILSFAQDPAVQLVDPAKGRNIIIDTTGKVPLVYPDVKQGEVLPKEVLTKLFKLDTLVKPVSGNESAILQKVATLLATLEDDTSKTGGPLSSNLDSNAGTKEKVEEFLNRWDKKK